MTPSLAACRELFDRPGIVAGKADGQVVSHGQHSVIARAAVEGIEAVARRDLEHVIAVEAPQRVVARTADDEVTCRRAGDGVVAVAAVDGGDAGQQRRAEVERLAGPVAWMVTPGLPPAENSSTLPA